MIKAWTEEAWEDFEYWTTQDRRMLKRILQLLKDIDRNGYEGIGKPERLSGDLASYWSRRIDDANRIVYRIDGSVVKIVQCGSHYRDKYPLQQPPPWGCFFVAAGSFGSERSTEAGAGSGSFLPMSCFRYSSKVILIFLSHCALELYKFNGIDISCRC